MSSKIRQGNYKEKENKNIENESLENLKKIFEERKKMKDDVITCEWCGITYPKGGWTFYKIQVLNMNLEKIIESIEKGIKNEDFKDENFEKHIICSDCYDHLEECKEC